MLDPSERSSGRLPRQVNDSSAATVSGHDAVRVVYLRVCAVHSPNMPGLEGGSGQPRPGLSRGIGFSAKRRRGLEADRSGWNLEFAAQELVDSIECGGHVVGGESVALVVGQQLTGDADRGRRSAGLLGESEGKVLEREAIYQKVWGYSMAHGDRSVDVFIRKLRNKLERRSPSFSYIHTHFGVGYRFAAEPPVVETEAPDERGPDRVGEPSTEALPASF